MVLRRDEPTVRLMARWCELAVEEAVVLMRTLSAQVSTRRSAVGASVQRSD